MEEVVEKKEEKKPRNVRRAENREKEFLDKLVLEFFTRRSASADPEGEAVGILFDNFNNQWITHCKNFNRNRNPIKLRYEAFTESVEFYLKMEREQMTKNAEANKGLGFEHWLRHVKMGEILFFMVLWAKIISFGNKEKQLKWLKKYYISRQKKKKV
jgi:hypothetical protein